MVIVESITKATAFLQLDVETAETLESGRKLVMMVSLVLTICSALMLAVNVFYGSAPMLLSTVVLTACFGVSFCICLFNYNRKLAGESIPIEARIIALADSIDAMASDRIYRNRRTREFLLQELQNGAGKQFDPKLVGVAVTLIEHGMLQETAV